MTLRNILRYRRCKKIIFISTILFSFFGIPSSQLFAQASLPEKDKYVLKPYMVIPWGDGKGQLPEVTDNTNTAIHYGPCFFEIDGTGSAFIYDGYDKKRVIKKFDPKGNESASVGDITPEDFSIQNMKIVVRSGNKIIFLRREDLSKVKEIDVPEKKYSTIYSKILNGTLYKPNEKKQPKIFVFDETDRSQNPNDEKNYFYIKGIVKGNEGHEALMVDDTEIMNLTEKMEKWTKEVVRGYTTVVRDKFGNFYILDAETYNEWLEFRHNDIIERTLFKFDPTGKLLLQLNTHQEHFLGWPSIAHHQFYVDQNGNIYSAWGDKDGFHIDEYQYLNEKKNR